MPERESSVEPGALSGALGLARRSGQLGFGARIVRERIRDGAARLVVVAGDASPRARERLARLCRQHGVPVVTCESGAALGRWLGLGILSAVAILDEGLASSILKPPDHR